MKRCVGLVCGFAVLGGTLLACNGNNVVDAAYEDTPVVDGAVDAVGDTTPSTDADSGVPVDVAMMTDAAVDTPIVVDSGMPTDGSVLPDGDGSLPDTGADAGVPDTSTGVDPCAPGALIDLATAGSRAGATTTYTGSTTSAPEVGAIPGECASSVNAEVALAYTTVTTSYLRVSTDNGGTAAAFDTVAWALSACAASGTFEGCSNDVSPTDTHSTFTTNVQVPAGTRIYLFVAGYTPAHPGSVTSGAFQLTVTEVPVGTVGGACDPAGITTLCPSASHCLSDSGSPVCMHDGAAGGRCTASPPGCNTGLGCNGDRLSGTSRCVTAVGAGASCDPSMQTNVCAAGLTCVSDASGATCM